MSLIDWKWSENQEDYGERWVKNRNKDGETIIYLSSFKSAYKGRKKWGVSIEFDDLRKETIFKIFKTEKQALAFIKSYIIKN